MEDDTINGSELETSSDPGEQKHFFSVLDSFRQYRRLAHFHATHVRRQNFYSLPATTWELLSQPPFSLLDTFTKVDDAIDANADLADAILDNGLKFFQYLVLPPQDTKSLPESGGKQDWHGTATKNDIDKARSTVHQMYRDWSSEGKAERELVYDTIFQSLDNALTKWHGTGRSDFHVLVPGAGLGRLVFELCRAGYDVEGNEISYHQLLASSFILNHTRKAAEWPLFPWAMSFSNTLSRADQLHQVRIPDIHPGEQPLAGSMNMSMGDFCVVYKKPEYSESFHAVVTLFFIDTAPNLLAYIETIKACLKPGGYWINIGPLLWHFDSAEKKQRVDTNSSVEDLGIAEAGGFELSQEEVLQLVMRCGFDIEKADAETIDTGYMQNPKSMLQNVYKNVHWVARKHEIS